MDVDLSGIQVPGSHPIVIIGPNGVGKTRLGVVITNSNQAERVAALRNVEIPEIPLLRVDQASREVKNALQQVLNEHWRQSFELQNLMAEILAEDRELAVAYRSEHQTNPAGVLDKKLSETRLSRIVKIWNRHFPGRQIKINYEPVVERRVGDQQVIYPIARMSEGERTALYLIARVVSCTKKVMVVDEPETYFHPLLARNLWDDLEAEARDLRFVYITHDIPFALSRTDAQFAIARSESRAELLPQTSSIPQDVISNVLGAASFSISASRLIFCEGLTNSLDSPILNAWHNCQKTAIVPVGSCEAVRECVSVFRGGQVTSGLEAFGYIDRDGWPDTYLDTPSVKALPVSEIEGIFALESVFKALAKFNGFDQQTAQSTFDSLLREARSGFSGATLNKEILNRAKLRVEVDQKALLNPLRPNPDLNVVRTAFQNAAPPGGWQAYMSNVFAAEEARLNDSLNGSAIDFVRDFPAKSYFQVAARLLKFVPEKMVETLCNALKLTEVEAEKEQKLRELRDAVVPALETFLWPRRA